MTGSGKTGLGVGIIEEALLNGIPCLVLDPKGDMGNLALNFPDFSPADFLPWVDEGEAATEGITPEELAAETTEKWKQGLATAGLGPDEMLRLRAQTEVTIYTPGSTSGVPLNVIGSLDAPIVEWADNAEVIRDEIEAFVSSLLVLADVEADPVSSPAHILLSTIIERFWSEGNDLDLATLIGQVPRPPFRKLGVFDVDDFFPEKDRLALAMKLNGVLASPTFSSWLEGMPLDIEELLWDGERTRAAVIYLAHLSDTERQFVVTLLLSKFITWMRSQQGASTLKTLIYMDEVFGFAPPTAEPPSKKPILTILKQARAFGAGMVLSTQNPVDLDYKAMSNAGTWMVGRLQTENDKRRILEGLDSAEGSVDISGYDKMISGLKKRQFLLHSTRQDPVVFATRWVMSYLAGPLTRDQVASITAGSAEKLETAATQATNSSPTDDAPPVAGAASVPVPPPAAEGIPVSFLAPAAPWAKKVGATPTSSSYQAGAAVSVQLLYDEAKADLAHGETYEAVLFPLSAALSTETVFTVDHDSRDFIDQPQASSPVFELPEAKIQNKSYWTSLQAQLKTHLVANEKESIYHNPELDIYSRVGETLPEFESRCVTAANEAKDIAIVGLQRKHKTRIDRAKATITKSENRVRDLEAEASSKGQEELLSGAGDLLGALFSGRKDSDAIGRAARRRSATSKAKSRVEAAEGKLAADMADLLDLEEELAAEIADLADDYDTKAGAIDEVEISLEKTDITVGEVRLVWIPVR